MCLCMITHSTSSHSASASNGSGMQSRVLRAFCSSRKKSRMGSKALRTSSIPSMMKPMSGQPRAMSVTCLIASHPLPITPRPVIEMLYVSYWMVYKIFFHPYTYLPLCSNCWCEMMLCYSINPVITDHQYQLSYIVDCFQNLSCWLEIYSRTRFRSSHFVKVVAGYSSKISQAPMVVFMDV